MQAGRARGGQYARSGGVEYMQCLDSVYEQRCFCDVGLTTATTTEVGVLYVFCDEKTLERERAVLLIIRPAWRGT